MRSNRHNLLMQPTTTVSLSPMLTTSQTMEQVDAELISQLSRRKLRGSTHDEQRRDRNNLRRLVLIQNSLVSITPCPSPSRSTPGPEDDSHFGGRVNPPSIPPHHPHPEGELIYDDDGFGYIFPDMSLYEDGADSDEDDDLTAEADWYDAVLSDLADDDEDYAYDAHDAPVAPSYDRLSSPHHPRSHNTGATTTTVDSTTPPSSLPVQLFHTPAYFGPRVPLPRPTSLESDEIEELSPPELSPPSLDLHIDELAAALPYFDQDDRSSVYSDESSEPSTPSSPCVLRRLPFYPQSSPQPYPSTSSSSSSPSSSFQPPKPPREPKVAQSSSIGSGLGDDSANRATRGFGGGDSSDEDLLSDPHVETVVAGFNHYPFLKHAHHHPPPHQQRVSPDYFSCHYAGRRSEQFW